MTTITACIAPAQLFSFLRRLAKRGIRRQSNRETSTLLSCDGSGNPGASRIG